MFQTAIQVASGSPYEVTEGYDYEVYLMGEGMREVSLGYASIYLSGKGMGGSCYCM